MDEGEIYMVSSKTSGKSYIGQTTSYFPSGRKNGSKGRWTQHLYKALNSKNECRALAGAIQKYGGDDFTLETIVKCNKSFLDFYEQKLILLYNTLSPNGYNIETGGYGCKKLHIETRELISKKRRFLNVSEKDKNTVLLAMKNLGISELPFGINYSHNHKTQNEGFIVIYNSIKKSFISKGRTLEEKLRLSLTILELLKQNNQILINDFEKRIVEESKHLISKSKKKDNIALEAAKNIGLAEIPKGIRFEKRHNRFYTYLPGQGCKMFTSNDPEKSLLEALKYLNQQQRESV